MMSDTPPSSSDQIFEQRQAQFLHYLQAKKDYILLAVVIFLGTFIRIQNLHYLIDATTGKYISIELDSTLFYRYAQYIVQHGSLFTIDTMRNYPLGAEISVGVFTSYFIAYLYNLLHIFIPSITVEFVNDIYPLVAMAILTFFLFLLVRRLFNYKVALLAVAFLNFMPPFLFRTLGGSSDHDALGIMFIFIAFYFYIRGVQSSRKKEIVLFGFLAAISALFGLASAGNAAFVFLTIALFSLIEILLSKFEKKDYILLSTFVITLTLFWKLFVNIPYNALFTSLSTSIIYFTFIVGSVSYLIQRDYCKKYLQRIPHIHTLPIGVQSFLLSSILIFIISLVLFGSSFSWNTIHRIFDEVLKTGTRFSTNRWILTVAENKRPYVTDWFSQYGTFFVYSFLLGSILLFYDMIKHFSKAKHLITLYIFFVFGYVFSRYSSDSVFNGDSSYAKLLLYASFLLFSAVFTILYFYSYYRDHTTYEQIRSLDKKYTFVFVLFFVQILAATSAIRLLFEFSPITAILSAFFFVSLLDYSSLLKNISLRWGFFALIILILISPFSFAPGILYGQYQFSLSQARASGPGYTPQWQYAGKWVRDNTPQNAVFAHWWDYGYWVQSGFQRPTITDGGNFIAWWNYLMGRHVLTAQNDSEPLKFLYGHNASYLLMVQEDIGKYGAYSSIGSDTNYDRFSFIPTFNLDPQMSEEKRNKTVFFYRGGTPLDEDLILNGKVYPKNAAGVAGVFLPLEKIPLPTNNTQQGFRILQPTVVLVHQNQRIDLALQCVYFDNQLYEFPTYTIPGCLRVIPTITNNQVNPLGAVLYLSRRTYTSLFSQLYLLNHRSDYFTPAYDDSSSAPLALYEGRLIGPIRIWKISYPKNITLTPDDSTYYVGTNYINSDLTKI